MKNLIYAFAICLLIISCEKNESGILQQGTAGKRALTEQEMILKENLQLTAEIIADIIGDEAVVTECNKLYREGRESYNLTFRDLISGAKGADQSFSNLRTRFLKKCGEAGAKGSSSDLVGFLMNSDSYLYCPYPSSFYQKGITSFTIASHPIDNDIENTGFRVEGKKITRVLVNEEYADKNPVLLIMPKDEIEESGKVLTKGDPAGMKSDPVYEVRVGKIRCADYCGGLFEGTLELRISRGYPEYNMTTNVADGKFTSVIPVDYPREYARAAIRDYTVHSAGGWYPTNVVWETNWRTTKVQQCVLVYEYDKVSESSISANVGYKQDDLSTTLTATAKTTYRGDFLGISEWDRDWFYATNNATSIFDEAKDGWTVRLTCPAFKLTTPARTINY